MSFTSMVASEALCEIRKTLRAPAFAIPTLIFPVAFYLMFAVVLPFGSRMPTYLVAGYAVFGVLSPALFGFGAGIAHERSNGWLLLKRASPMLPSAYFMGKLCMALVYGAVIVFSLFVLANTVGGQSLSAAQMLTAGLVTVFGAVPFCVLGLAIGVWTSGQGAIGIVNLIFLPMSVLSGLWFPLSIMPPVFHTIAWFLPPFHLAQLALKPFSVDSGHPAIVHVLALCGFTLVFAWAALKGYRRESMAMNVNA